jgi:hypothetical protein
MSKHWDSATKAISVLAYLISDADADGPALFIAPEPHASTWKKAEHLIKRLESFPKDSFEGDVSLVPHVNQVCHDIEEQNKHSQLKLSRFRVGRDFRPTTLYILTDDISQEEIQYFTTVFRQRVELSLNPGMRSPVFSLHVQFITFGTDRHSPTWLQTLDDSFSEKAQDLDIFDTEPWDGNVYKMLLGSFDRTFDDKVGTSSSFALVNNA